MLRERLDRHGPQSAYPVQDEGELLPRHRDLGQLEGGVAGMAHDPAARLMSLTWRLRSDQCLSPLGKDSLRRKFLRL
jgi:hypothetical protein